MKQEERTYNMIVDDIPFEVTVSISESMTIRGLSPCGYLVKHVCIVGSRGHKLDVNMHELPFDIADAIHKKLNDETT